MNKIILIGNTTRDPELQTTANGKQLCRFSLAVSRKFDKEQTDFFNCTAWEKTGELIAKYVRKGNKLGIVGRLEINESEKDGVKTRHHNIIVEDVDFLTAKGSNEESASPIKTTEESSSELPF